jgi:hypothetical protein
MHHKRPLDSGGGITSTVHFDDDSEKFVIAREQDVELVLEANKHLQNDRIGSVFGSSRAHTAYKIADVPAIILEQWMKEDGVNLLALPKWAFADYIKRKLANPDYQFLRTAPDKYFRGTRGSQRTHYLGNAPTAGAIAAARRPPAPIARAA